MNILIVDDSPAIQMIVRRALEKEGFDGHEFRTAASGTAALEIIESWFPDLMITDWHMPGMSGLELLQLLRQTYTQPLLVGFVTTESVQERLAEAERNGAAFILAKPFKDRDLGDAVRGALSRHEADLAEAARQAAEQKAATEQQAAAAQAQQAKAAAAAGALFAAASPEVLEAHLSQVLQTAVTVKEIPVIDYTTMSTPCQIAFYGLGDSTVIRAFAILDRPGVALVGALLAGIPASEVLPSGPLTPPLVKPVVDWLDNARQTLFQGAPSLVLLRTQTIPQVSAKLQEILDKGQGRRCYSVAAPGFFPALLTLIAH